MGKRFGIFIALGLLIGSIFGIFWGTAIDNIPLGITISASGGIFIGWFIAAAVMENEKKGIDE